MTKRNCILYIIFPILLFSIFCFENHGLTEETNTAPVPIVLSTDDVIQGMNLPKGTFVEFYPDGQVMLVKLSLHQTIQGVICAANTETLFHTNDKIKAATLAGNQKVRNVKFNKGTRLWFDENGKAIKARLSTDHEIYEKEFHKNGVIYRAKTGFWQADPPITNGND